MYNDRTTNLVALHIPFEFDRRFVSADPQLGWCYISPGLEHDNAHLFRDGGDEPLVVRNQNYPPVPCRQRSHESVQTLSHDGVRGQQNAIHFVPRYPSDW
jgi:hypothetical protein